MHNKDGFRGFRICCEKTLSQTGIREHPVNAWPAVVIVRIAETLRDAAKGRAALKGMNRSGYVRQRLIDNLAREGTRRIAGSVAEILARVKQPRGGSLPLSSFDTKQRSDSLHIVGDCNISPYAYKARRGLRNRRCLRRWP